MRTGAWRPSGWWPVSRGNELARCEAWSRAPARHHVWAQLPTFRRPGTGGATVKRATLEFFAQAHGMTSPGRYAAQLQELPNDVDALTQLIQHLVIYDVVARDFYRVSIPTAREAEIHIRPLEGLLHALVALEDRPLTVARPTNRRLAGRCHHF